MGGATWDSLLVWGHDLTWKLTSCCHIIQVRCACMPYPWSSVAATHCILQPLLSVLQGAGPLWSPFCLVTIGRSTDRRLAVTYWRTCPVPPCRPLSCSRVTPTAYWSGLEPWMRTSTGDSHSLFTCSLNTPVRQKTVNSSSVVSVRTHQAASFPHWSVLNLGRRWVVLSVSPSVDCSFLRMSTNSSRSSGEDETWYLTPDLSVNCLHRWGSLMV